MIDLGILRPGLIVRCSAPRYVGRIVRVGDEYVLVDFPGHGAP